MLDGPHGAPDFFTEADIEAFFAATWKVHYNSSRTGVRLIGPKPEWARSDGGEAGLHPSNIHDTAYAIGAVDFTGDMPVILGPDGPSLGGFVCPVTLAKRRVVEARAAALRRPRAISNASRRKSAQDLHRRAARPHSPPSARSPKLPLTSACSRRNHARYWRACPRTIGQSGRRVPARRRLQPPDRIRPDGARFRAAPACACPDVLARSAEISRASSI